MDNNNITQNGNESAFKKGFCIALVIIILFSSGYFVGSFLSFDINANLTGDGQSVSVNAPVTNAPVTNVPVTNSPVTNAPVTNAPSVSENAASAPSAAPSGTAPTSKEDIIALYNEASNKVKTEATKVTRNFKNTRYDEAQSVLPSALKSMADPMMEKYLKDDTEPVEYLTKEEIIENYPAPKQTYSSMLTAADVTEATCIDNGTEYEITLNLATSVNPTPGAGVGAACHIMDVSSITSNEAASKMIKKFDTNYSGCVIKCKIDKASNRVIWANFYTPFSIDAVVNVVFSDVSTIIFMSYERDYTVTY